MNGDSDPDRERPQPTAAAWQYEFRVGLYEDLTIQGAGLEIVARHKDGRLVELVPDHWQPRESGRANYENQVPISAAGLQHMMNMLWDMGVRPSAGVASVGQAEAQKAHIADLEKINERLLKIVEHKAYFPEKPTWDDAKFAQQLKAAGFPVADEARPE